MAHSRQKRLTKTTTVTFVYTVHAVVEDAIGFRNWEKKITILSALSMSAAGLFLSLTDFVANSVINRNNTIKHLPSTCRTGYS